MDMDMPRQHDPGLEASPVRGASQDPAEATGCTTVYFDGACPLCSREIAMYRRLEGADGLRWVDITTASTQELGGDLTREQALARFHVRDEQGHLVSGAAGFVAIWGRLPGLGWLAWLATRPPISWLLEPAYRAFLKFRPFLTRSPVPRRSV